MFETFMLLWGLPVSGLVFAIVAYLWLRYESRRLDRKFGPDA